MAIGTKADAINWHGQHQWLKNQLIEEYHYDLYTVEKCLRSIQSDGLKKVVGDIFHTWIFHQVVLRLCS